ncbi:homing endonuclease associated repeat-containing protein [Brachybacterium phenoliresistens]|uniref:homing endonuclease associated repeat-containing protein n=1 Tax=Brachybacterium phenoliresistens TaxID=396014 RepID=UPI0031D547E4
MTVTDIGRGSIGQQQEGERARHDGADSPHGATPTREEAPHREAEAQAGPAVVPDADVVVDLAQQGYTTGEIAEFFGADTAQVEQVLDGAIPGGAAAVRVALRGRLRAWASRSDGDSWQGAEPVFGIPHANITRLVRSPEQDAELAEGEGPEAHRPGYLDAALSGTVLADERARICVRCYAMGATLQELGDRFGVTRERIRQIITKHTPWSTKDIGRTLRGLREAREQEHREAVRAWSQAHSGDTLESGARLLGMTEGQVRDLLGVRRKNHLAPKVRPTSTARRSDEQILDDLRAFHRETGERTSSAFAAWAKQHGVPGNQTAAIRFGTWNEALRAAGLTAERGRPRSAHSEDDLWAALIAAVAAPDGGTSHTKVDAWLQRHDGAPSFALIRQRLPYRWAEIAEIALAVLRGEPVGQGDEFDESWRARVTAPRDWNAAAPEPTPTQHLRDAMAELGGNLTMATYRSWASAQRRPTAQTLMRRSNLSWGELVREAGGIAGGTKPEWTDAHCRDAVQDFRAAQPGGGTDAYTQWAREYARPSLATVIKRLGSWREAVEDSASGE